MLEKFATILEGASMMDKVGTGLFLKSVGELHEAYESQEKTAADQTDVAAAQIDQVRIQSNPVSKTVEAFMMKQPPANLAQLVQLFSQKLEQDLRSSISTGPAITDPMLSENKNLEEMVKNLTLKRQIRQLMEEQTQQMAQQAAQASGAMGMAPNPAIAGAPMALGAAPPPEMMGEQMPQGGEEEAAAMQGGGEGGEEGGMPPELQQAMMAGMAGQQQ